MKILPILLFLLFTHPLMGEETSQPIDHENSIVINFPKISMSELIKFVSRIANVNVIADPKLLDFEVNFVSSKPLSPIAILSILNQMLKEQGLEVKQEKNCLFITKNLLPDKETVIQERKEGKFYVFKLQYHQGSEILEALKQIAHCPTATTNLNEEISQTILSMQWIQSTNSLFFSGSLKAVQQVRELIASLDTPLKQVLIEVLVIETSLRNSLDFGLEWSFNNKFKSSLNTAGGSLLDKGVFNKSEILSQLPKNRSFGLGIIGDILFHKGRSFISLGSLISSLQKESDSSIVLNQKIIAQENKNSKIFVGDNIPFTGAIVKTGTNQQITANVEYRDVGVSLNITPSLGDGDMISLEITEEITEAVDHFVHKSDQVSGIKTTKTNMATSAHVPDGHFLILSGMTKSIKTKETSGPPCLGGIPLIGALFKKNEQSQEKRNLLIFVKPHIIHSSEEYKQLSKEAEETLKKEDVTALNKTNP